MPRIARVVCPGVPHHVTQRGNRRGTVFFTDEDRRGYLQLLREYSVRHAVEVLAYCLMSNHVHLVVVPTTAYGLHRALKPLHMRHAQRVNRACGWSGHLWQGRYFSSALDEAHLWAAIRYVERNPVRAGMTRRAQDFPWSSATAHCGGPADPVLTPGAYWLRQFAMVRDWAAFLGHPDEPRSLEILRRNAGKGLPCGSAEFLDALQQATGRIIRDRPVGRPATPARKG